MAQTKTRAEVVEIEDIGVEEVEQPEQAPDPSGVRYVEVGDVTPVTLTDNFLSGHAPHDGGGVIDLGPTIVEPEQETYQIRVIQDIEPVFLGPGTQLPPLYKGHTYTVPKRVYDYLAPKGLIEGR